MEIVVVVEACEDAPGGGVVPEIIEHPVHLIEPALPIPVLHPQLVAVGLADGAGLVGPRVPDVRVQVPDVAGLLLPDPQKLVHRAPEGHFADGLDGELPPEIVAVNEAESLYGVGALPILPAGADGQSRVPGAVGEDLLAVLDEYLVGVTHGRSPSLVFGL